MFHYLKYSINTTNSIYFIQLIYFITILLSYLFLIIFIFYISFIFKLTNQHSIHIILNYLSIHQIIFHLIHFTIFELLKPIHLSSIEKTINSFKYSSLYNYQIIFTVFINNSFLQRIYAPWIHNPMGIRSKPKRVNFGSQYFIKFLFFFCFSFINAIIFFGATELEKIEESYDG